MGKKKKKKGNKITDTMTKKETNTYKKVVDVINKSVVKIPPKNNGKLHAKTCICSECNRKSIGLIPGAGALDHGINCVCWKCKKDRGFGNSIKGSSNTSYSSSSYTPCHDGNVFVFEHQGISVYGGGNLKDSEPNKVDLVLDLDRNVRAVSWEDDLPEDWSCRSRASSSTKVLDLFIKDMHAPEHIDATFWKLFWSDLRKEAHKNEGKLSILVMCQGGHGRTGVVLASLIMASAYNKVGIPENIHVVKWLRENYCEKAVESSRQCDYLTRLWDMKFIEATKGGTTSFVKGATTTATNNGSNNVDPDEDSEIPTSDSKCITCSTKRTQNNRVLYSADLKTFECDNCFGIRADQLEKEEGADLEKIMQLEYNRVDLTEECNGKECSDQYDDLTGIWSTNHTFTDDCNKTNKEGEDNLEGIPFHNMTNAQYQQWVQAHL